MIGNMADKSNSTSPSYDTAIYHELSPKLTWLVRIINILVTLMLMISIVICIIQGKDNNSYYLLIGNLIISIIVCSVVNWWYRSGDLGSEKYWFVLLIGIVILFQCISFDIFVFKEESPSPTPTPRTTPRHNRTVTFPWTSMLPASTTRKMFQ